MSKTDEENQEYFERLHKQFLLDPGYKIWLEQQKLKEQKLWDNTVQKDPDGL